MAQAMLQQRAIEHWTEIHCWRENGDELTPCERISVLRKLFEGDDLPPGILFFDPALAVEWQMRELYLVPLRDEVDWSYFPEARHPKWFPPKPKLELAEDPEATPPTHARAGEVLAVPCPNAPRAPRRAAPNAPAPECRLGQAVETYPAAPAVGPTNSNAVFTPPGEKT